MRRVSRARWAAVPGAACGGTRACDGGQVSRGAAARAQAAATCRLCCRGQPAHLIVACGCCWRRQRARGQSRKRCRGGCGRGGRRRWGRRHVLLRGGRLGLLCQRCRAVQLRGGGGNMAVERSGAARQQAPHRAARHRQRQSSRRTRRTTLQPWHPPAHTGLHHPGLSRPVPVRLLRGKGAAGALERRPRSEPPAGSASMASPLDGAADGSVLSAEAVDDAPKSSANSSSESPMIRDYQYGLGYLQCMHIVPIDTA